MKSAVRASLLACVLVASTGYACVLVDPVPELQKPPRRAPAIVKTAVVPDATRPLVRVPVEFVVPVRVPDPGQDLFWEIFVDGVGTVPGSLKGGPDNPDLYPIRFRVSDLTGFYSAEVCHRIEVVVSSEPVRPVGVIDPVLTDSIGWWYVPDGGSCGLFDAAVLDGSHGDGGDDGGEAGGPVQ
jgi:hypothetical protein